MPKIPAVLNEKTSLYKIQLIPTATPITPQSIDANAKPLANIIAIRFSEIAASNNNSAPIAETPHTKTMNARAKINFMH